MAGGGPARAGPADGNAAFVECSMSIEMRTRTQRVGRPWYGAASNQERHGSRQGGGADRAPDVTVSPEMD